MSATNPGSAGNAPRASAAYEVVIGLEVHAQLLTESKLFCTCSTATHPVPNSSTCPVCLGHPGAMPYPNARAVDLAVRLGLALGCSVHRQTEWARKHYFYPDLPKGYQITQFAHPLCTGGALPLDPPVPLVRIHLEEDAGRSKHTVLGPSTDAASAGDTVLDPVREATSEGEARLEPAGHASPEGDARLDPAECASAVGDAVPGRDAVLKAARGATLLDFGRAGVPLVEIVSEPALRSPEEAGTYLSELRRIVRYLGVSDGNMEDGSLRCDANVSLRPRGTESLGTRTEIKNLNSIRSVVRALRYEAERQSALLAAGEPVAQETRLFDETTGATHVMRAKEESSDYRYCPEPDLPLLELSDERIVEIALRIPELPHERRARFAGEYGLTAEEIAVLTETPELGDYFETVARSLRKRMAGPGTGLVAPTAASGADADRETTGAPGLAAPRLAAKWIRGDVLGRASTLPPAEQLVELLHRVAGGRLSGPMAKEALAELAETGDTVEAIVARHGWVVVGDEDELRAWVREVMAAHPTEVASYRQGRTALLHFFVGQVMKLSRGLADPVALRSVLAEELGPG
ncbi:MAG: Asp-tRNA(Asn)/Glu-tRNA(Gln) amidotransferase subunit GatB [Candidatus Eisenbacteria bacterium]